MKFLLCLAAAAAASSSDVVVATLSQSAHDQAVDACSKLNQTAKLGIMHGFGKIDGYSRNSGCGSICGRDTFRWDNGALNHAVARLFGAY